MTFAEELKRDREGLRISQREFAERIGLSQSTIAKYESGILMPRAKTRERIRQYIHQNQCHMTLYDVKAACSQQLRNGGCKKCKFSRDGHCIVHEVPALWKF